MMAYVLDTNHCIYLMNAWNTPEEKLSCEEQNTRAVFHSRPHDVVYMSEASVGELFYGVERSQRKEYNRTRLNILISAVPPLPITRTIWETYGRTKAELRQVGKIIPDIDLLIAATVQCYQMILVANDKHMKQLPSSFVQENWAAAGFDEET